MTTTTLAERVQMALSRDKTLTQAGLARACGIHRASVNAWVKGGTDSIDGKYLTSAAMYLRVEAHWLATGEGAMEPTGILARLQSDLPVDGWMRTTEHQNLIRNTDNLSSGLRLIPLLDRKTAGMHKQYTSGDTPLPPDTFKYTGQVGPDTFAYKVDDNTMEPDFRVGTIAIIEADTPPQHGDIVLIEDGTGAYLRKLIIDGDMRYVETLNTRLPARPLTVNVIGWVSGEYHPRRAR